VLSGALFALLLPVGLAAQGRGGGRGDGAPPDTTGAGGAPSLQALLQQSARESDLRIAARRFQQDLQVLRQRYDVPMSPVRMERERAFYRGWMARLETLDPAGLNEAGRAEHASLRASVLSGLAELDEQERQLARMAPLLPFARSLQLLQERRRERLDVDPEQAAQTVEDARKEVLRLTAAVEARRQNGPPAELASLAPDVSAGTLTFLAELREPLESWYTFYFGFDPLFTWWVRAPYRELLEALDAYETAIRAEWGVTKPR
jgi:hypothetical protein